MPFSPRYSVVFGCIALALVAGCSQKKPAGSAAAPASPKTQPVEVVNVTRRDMVESVSLVGSLAPNETAQIRAEISGQIRAVLFEEGQHVKKGQVLLKIDDSELRAQLAQASARHKLAELNYKRSQNLSEAQSLSQAEMDRTRSDYASAQAEVDLLSVRIDKMEIKAPFDGVVGARTISPGDYITAATVVTTLDDLSRLKIDFQVPERFTYKVAPGTHFSVRAQTQAGERRAEGEVYFISSVIDRATRSSQVKGYLRTSAEGLQPGMFAGIELILAVRKNVLTVPEGAILTTPRGTQIITVIEKNGEKVAGFVSVTLGLRERGLVEVIPEKPELLAENQMIVASGVGALILYQDAKLDPRPLRPEFRLGD